MPADSHPPLGTYADERHPIPSQDGTANPFYIICTQSKAGTLTFLAGVWFSRKAAAEHLRATAYNYPKGAIVYCASGHESDDYRHLCETGRIPDAR